MDTKYIFEFWEESKGNWYRRFAVEAESILDADAKLKKLYSYHDRTGTGEAIQKRWKEMFSGLKLFIRPANDLSCNVIKVGLSEKSTLKQETPDDQGIGEREHKHNGFQP